MTGQQKSKSLQHMQVLVATQARSGMGTTHPSSSGCLLSTGLLFPKLDNCEMKTIWTRWMGVFFLLLKEQKFSCPWLAEEHKASSPCAVGHNTVQNFHSDCNPYMESAALNRQCMTHVSSPRRNKNNGKTEISLDQHQQLQSVCGLQLLQKAWSGKGTVMLAILQGSLSQLQSLLWTLQHGMNNPNTHKNNGITVPHRSRKPIVLNDFLFNSNCKIILKWEQNCCSYSWVSLILFIQFLWYPGSIRVTIDIWNEVSEAFSESMGGENIQMCLADVAATVSLYLDVTS